MSYHKTNNAHEVIVESSENGSVDLLKLEENIEKYAQDKLVFQLKAWAMKKCPRCRDGDIRVSNPEVFPEKLDWHTNVGLRESYYTRCKAYPLWEVFEQEKIKLMVYGKKS